MTLKQGKSGGNWGKFKRSFVFRLPIFSKKRSPVRIDSGEYYGKSPLEDEILSQAIRCERNSEKAEKLYREAESIKRLEKFIEEHPPIKQPVCPEMAVIVCPRCDSMILIIKNSGKPWVGGCTQCGLDYGTEYNFVMSLNKFTDTLTMPVWKFVWRRINGYFKGIY